MNSMGEGCFIQIESVQTFSELYAFGGKKGLLVNDKKITYRMNPVFKKFNNITIDNNQMGGTAFLKTQENFNVYLTSITITNNSLGYEHYP